MPWWSGLEWERWIDPRCLSIFLRIRLKSKCFIDFLEEGVMNTKRDLHHKVNPSPRSGPNRWKYRIFKLSTPKRSASAPTVSLPQTLIILPSPSSPSEIEKRPSGLDPLKMSSVSEMVVDGGNGTFTIPLYPTIGRGPSNRRFFDGCIGGRLF